MVSFRTLIAATAALVAVAATAHLPTTMPATTTMTEMPKMPEMPKHGKCGDSAPATTMPPMKTYPAMCDGKTPAGERCAGAPGKKYIEYLGCCEGYECVEDKDMGWGKFCKPMKMPMMEPMKEPKCYKEGERCMGAPNKPYVKYMDCCGKDMMCMEDKSMGWGSYCKKMPTYY